MLKARPSSSTTETSKAANALKAYRSTRSTIKPRAANRAIFEAQLEKIAQQEISTQVPDSMVAGLFLLCILSIQENSEGGFFVSLWRNGLAAIVDPGFDDEATGSCLEKALGCVEFVVPDKGNANNTTELVPASRLAVACTAFFPPEKLVGFSSASIQEAFLSMNDEFIIINGNTSVFFTPSQKEIAYKHSYLCAMQDISVRAQAENIIPTSDVEKEMVSEWFKVIENAMSHLSDLSENIVVVFKELAGGQYALLRTKLVCFLVLNYVYSALDLTELSSVKHFLERTLKEFFNPKNFSSNAEFREQANYLSRQFFNAENSTVLFKNVSLDASTLFRDVHQSETALLAWTQQYDFGVTLRDKYLLENFLAYYAPISGELAR